jgi:uncharacterized protein YaiI (UPF0178 family)
LAAPDFTNPEPKFPKPQPRLLIDADACPVKAEAERVATRFGIEMLLVSNGGVRPSANPLVRSIFVPSGADQADMWIADTCTALDVVVTSDIPLAAKCLAKGAQVIKHNGEPLTSANIGMVLAARDLMADLRSANPFMQMSGKAGAQAFSKTDRARFLDVLDRMLRASTLRGQ